MLTVVVIIIIIIITLVYIVLSFYLKHNDRLDIAQCRLADLSMDLLYEKTPVIVSEQLMDPTHLLSSLFRYSYAYSRRALVRSGESYTCRSKFTVMWCGTNDTQLDLIAASSPRPDDVRVFYECPGAEFVTVKLRRNQAMILPPHWSVIVTSDVSVLEIDDPLSKLIRLIV